MSSRPPTRKRTQTLARLMAGAAEVVSEKGFQLASVDEIAARAGLTKGAVYSNFDSKEALFLALISSKALRLNPKFPDGGSFKACLRALGEACAALLPEARAQSAFVAEFLLYALRHEDMRRRLAQLYAADFAAHTARLVAMFPDAKLRVSAEAFPVVVQALSLGLVYQHFLTPDAVTAEVAIAAFEALA